VLTKSTIKTTAIQYNHGMACRGQHRKRTAPARRRKRPVAPWCAPPARKTANRAANSRKCGARRVLRTAPFQNLQGFIPGDSSRNVSRSCISKSTVRHGLQKVTLRHPRVKKRN